MSGLTTCPNMPNKETNSSEEHASGKDKVSTSALWGIKMNFRFK
jgi:hypothetical protein